MKSFSLFEKIICYFLLASILYALFIYYTNPAYFDTLVEEDGFYENLTALFLLLASFTLLFKFFKYRRKYTALWSIGILLMMLGLFFGAGEEISWGQRIFHIQSSSFFLKNNAQKETNFHNLIIDNVKLNKLIFSNLMSICFGLYFLVLPILRAKSKKISALINKFGLSVARAIHIVIFIIATLLIILPIHHSRKWEIWEYTFALIMFLIVYNPANRKEIFFKD